MDDFNHPIDPDRFHPGRVLARGLAERARRSRTWVAETASTARLHLTGRPLTPGERSMIAWMFGRVPRIHLARIIGHNFWWPAPNRRAMAPDGNIYFPAADYHPDFHAPGVPVTHQARFMHEATHLYQHYKLGKWLMLQAPFDRTYDYVLEPGKPLHAYGIEQMGQIVEDFYLLRHGRRRETLTYTAASYAGLLPLRD